MHLTLLPAIFSLPMVLLYKTFGVCNITVDETSCNIVWIEIASFAVNIRSHQRLIR